MESKPVPIVLVVDDEADLRELLELTLLKMGLRVEQAVGVAEARDLLSRQQFDLCLTDMRMADGDGLEVVQYIQTAGLDVPVAVITAYGSTDNAVAALKAGAFDYLSKPIALDQLRSLVRSALRTPETATSSGTVDGRALLGTSAPIVAVRDLIDRVAKSVVPVHISGESGCGKELAALRLHDLSGRTGRFIAVNCGAIPETLMESEFFGYRKGAFTGADTDRDGFFHAAAGGTLFLDEVADLPLAMQVKLLRAIQERKVRRVGSPGEEPIDIRIVSATHRDLAARVSEGLFRQDLLYRLNVIEVRMPSLRDMRPDIPLLANATMERLAARGGRRAPLAADALSALVQYDFPGNVRELENIIERAMALCTEAAIGAAELQLLPREESRLQRTPGDGAVGGACVVGLQTYLDEVEKAAILEALEKAQHNRTAAARLLGVTFRSFRYRMQRLGIARDDD